MPGALAGLFSLNAVEQTRPTYPAKFRGLPVRIENVAGSTRSGIGPDGVPWTSVMAWDYGEMPRHEGADGDPLDVFIGPDEASDLVVVINQVRQDDPSAFDEHKVMLGFPSVQAAIDGYLACYEKGWVLGPITVMDWRRFLDWLATGDKTVAANGWQPGDWTATADGLRNHFTGQVVKTLTWNASGEKRTYVSSPADAPKGAAVQQGKRGGYYYVPTGQTKASKTAEEGVKVRSSAVTKTLGRTLKSYAERPRPTEVLTESHVAALDGKPLHAYHEFLKPYRRTFHDALQAIDKVASNVGALDTLGRLKGPKSLKEKVEVRGKTSPGDIIGLTMEMPDLGGVDGIKDALEQGGFRVRAIDDKRGGKQDDYYSAIHYDLEFDGQPVELQVMSAAMQEFKAWAHPRLYKAWRNKENPHQHGEMKAWAVEQVKPWLMAIERGEAPGPQPDGKQFGWQGFSPYVTTQAKRKTGSGGAQA